MENAKLDNGNSERATGDSKLDAAASAPTPSPLGDAAAAGGATSAGGRQSGVSAAAAIAVAPPLPAADAVVVDDPAAIVIRPLEDPGALAESDASSTTLPLLLEVGCEEIPARFLRDAEKTLGERVQAALKEARLTEAVGMGVLVEAPDAALHIELSELAAAELPIATFSTPRRLVVHVPKVLAQQPDKVEELLGPPVKVAIDAQGNYTRAAESFAQKNAARRADLTRTTTPKGEYLSLKKTTQGRPAHAILPEVLPAAILGLSFPKSMYWTGKQAPRFVRPIRWIVALLGEGERAVTLHFEILGVTAGNVTFGHRAKSRAPIAVDSLKDYAKKLRQSHVLVDYDKRKSRLLEQAHAVVGPAGGKIVPDDWLADWIANSTEWPRPMLGTFDERFLHLPREILITVMRDHQRYFAVEPSSATGAAADRGSNGASALRRPEIESTDSASGQRANLEAAGSPSGYGLDSEAKLAPHFVAVLNMDSDPKGLICQGHQRVLTARFRDAEFFWTSDQRLPLRDRIARLDQVTYQVKLGSYGDKIRRMKVLAKSICEALEVCRQLPPNAAPHVLRAVELCKCDLTAQMVQEFTELQGVVGGLYAKFQGEPEAVSIAIYDHYLPLGADGKSPRTLTGAIVSLADKVDAVVGGFIAGLEPTGSRDPFALRRAGNGIVKVLLDFSLNIFMPDMLVASLQTYGREGLNVPELQTIAEFLRERLKFHLETSEGCRHDTVRAVMAVAGAMPVNALRRARALEQIRDTEDYVALAAAAKRTRNILRKSATAEEYSSGTLNPQLLQEEAEIELYGAYLSLFDAAGGQAGGEQDFGAILTLTAHLRPFVDKFFDKVLVMHPDEKIRRNRLQLLHLFDTKVFSRVADLSEIAGHVDAST